MDIPFSVLIPFRSSPCISFRGSVARPCGYAVCTNFSRQPRSGFLQNGHQFEACIMRIQVIYFLMDYRLVAGRDQVNEVARCDLYEERIFRSVDGEKESARIKLLPHFSPSLDFSCQGLPIHHLSFDHCWISVTIWP